MAKLSWLNSPGFIALNVYYTSFSVLRSLPFHVLALIAFLLSCFRAAFCIYLQLGATRRCSKEVIFGYSLNPLFSFACSELCNCAFGNMVCANMIFGFSSWKQAVIIVKLEISLETDLGEESGHYRTQTAYLIWLDTSFLWLSLDITQKSQLHVEQMAPLFSFVLFYSLCYIEEIK